MALVSFARTTVTVLRPGTIEDHGSSVPDYTSLTPHGVSGCVVQPLSSSEDTVGRDQTTATRLVHAPFGSDIRRLDLVTLPDEAGQWRVRDEPAPWRSPTGAVSNLQVVLERYTEGI